AQGEKGGQPRSHRAISRRDVLRAHEGQTRLGRPPRPRPAVLMLTELRIRNFAIIEQVTLPLDEAFNVLSGETGTGKSIILDAFGGSVSQADLVRSTHAELSAVRREITSLSARRAEAEKRADYLRHVAREIEDARLSPGEDAKLEDEARVLENADELRTLASSLHELLSGEDTSVLSQLGAAQRPLTSIERIDPS